MMGKLIVIGVVMVLIVVNGCTFLFLLEPEEPVQPVKQQPSAQKKVQQQVKIVEEEVEREVPSSPPRPPEGHEVNRTAPDFAITLLSGEVLSKESILREKALVIYTFSTYCIPCINEFGENEHIYPQYRNKVRFIAMSMDEREDAAALQSFRKHYLTRVGAIEFATQSPEAIVSLQLTTTGMKVGINKNETIVERDSFLYKHNDWKNLFKLLS